MDSSLPSQSGSHLAAVRKAFAKGQYAQVIASLNTLTQEDDAELLTLLAVSLLRSGQFGASEWPLASAMALGSQEAAVEYGNLLRAESQSERAAAHFEKILPVLTGELRYRALRWYGVTLCESGKPDGMSHVEEARLGYLSLGERHVAARISHTLATLLFTRGDYLQARRMLEPALPILQEDPNPRGLLNALFTLIDLQAEEGLLEDAQVQLQRAQQLAQSLDDQHTQLQVDARSLLIHLKQGDYGTFSAGLLSLRSRAEQLGEKYVYTFASNNLANHLSRTGQHAAALRVLAELTALYPQRSNETSLMAALLTLRRGNAPDALGQFLNVREKATQLGMRQDATRALLLAALAAYQMNDFPTTMSHLSEALNELAGWPHLATQHTLRQELHELEEMLSYARRHPDLRELIIAALERTTAAVASPDDLLLTPHVLELNILGPQPRASLSGAPLHFRLRYSLPILCYLALQPGRTRQEITTDLWADEDPVRSGSNFRQCLAEIRKVCGADAIVMSGPYHEPRYDLSPKLDVHLDSQRLQQILESEHAAEARHFYKGTFLQGLPESEWIGEWRRTLTLSMNLKLRAEITQALANDDERAAVRLSTALLDIDPEDLEIEELRLELARKVCSPWEIAQYQSKRERRLN